MQDMALTISHLQCSMYDQYAYYHYETVEEKPVPKPPQLVSLSDERAARQRRDEKGLCSFYSHFENHVCSCFRAASYYSPKPLLRLHVTIF